MAKHLTPKGGGVYLPGFRDDLRQGYEREVLRGDPRVLPAFTEDWTSEERRQTNAASPVIRQAERTLARIDAGEDIETRRPSAHHWPELSEVSWYADPRCAGSLCPQMTPCARFTTSLLAELP